MISIAIDGPSGAGKSSVARELSNRLGFIYLDTGALYRGIGCYFIDRKIDYNNEIIVNENINNIKIDVRFENGVQNIYICSVNVTDKIRTEEVSKAASKVSSMKNVRAFLLDLQKNMATKNNVIMDGRDIGTVVLPNADVKIFLTASPIERAKRRHEELIRNGNKISYEEVLKSINERDFNDSNREIAPLKPADDAVLVDTTNYGFNQVVDGLLKIIEEKIR